MYFCVLDVQSRNSIASHTRHHDAQWRHYFCPQVSVRDCSAFPQSLHKISISESTLVGLTAPSG